MNRFTEYIRRKLSVRVSLWVVLIAGFIFITALSLVLVQSGIAVRQEAINRATQILDKTSLEVEGIRHNLIERFPITQSTGVPIAGTLIPA